MALQCEPSRWSRAAVRSDTFFAQPDYCETYGKDVVTGEPVSFATYRERNPAGKAMIKPAPYVSAAETPTAEFPYALVTGRTVYHFHTRTKSA
jgi:anaerobic selenocysteine-containing dehydrogenase